PAGYASRAQRCGAKPEAERKKGSRKKFRLHSVSKKWQTPLFRESKFGQPEVARICKELILQAKSTTQQGAVFPQGKTAVAKRLGFSFEKPTVRRQSRLTRMKVGEAAAPPTPPEGFLTV